MAPALRHTRNADLAKYKKAGALEPSPSAADKLLSLVLRLLIVALWKSVKALSVPFGKLFAVYFWLGKSVVSISLWLEKLLLRTVGWLSGTGFSRADSRLGRLSHYYLGIDVKRWHAGIGKWACRAHSVQSAVCPTWQGPQSAPRQRGHAATVA